MGRAYTQTNRWVRGHVEIGYWPSQCIVIRFLCSNLNERQGHRDHVLALAVSTDGTVLASGLHSFLRTCCSHLKKAARKKLYSSGTRCIMCWWLPIRLAHHTGNAVCNFCRVTATGFLDWLFAKTPSNSSVHHSTELWRLSLVYRRCLSTNHVS